MLLTLAKTGLAGGAAVYLARQCRRPSWLVGRLLARGMNASHARLTGWALSHVEIGREFAILDVGCGGGQTVNVLASAATDGKIAGLDYSPASVAVARDRNAALIEQGRVEIRQGSVSQLPFPDETFDLVTAVETHYYWPDLPSDVREVMRVLKTGGTFMIVAEAYRGRRNDWLFRPVMRLLLRAAYLSAEEHRALLSGARFCDVEVVEERARGWLCAIGRRATAGERQSASRGRRHGGRA